MNEKGVSKVLPVAVDEALQGLEIRFVGHLAAFRYPVAKIEIGHIEFRRLH